MARARIKKPSKNSLELTPSAKCSFCHKEFAREKSLITHICRLKKRHLDKDTPAVRNGFSAYSIFYLRNYGREPTYDNFAQSSLYEDFVKFGRYICDLGAVSPKEFSTFVIDLAQKENIPITKWCRDALYERFLRDLIMRESPDRALNRTVKFIEEWSLTSRDNFFDFFRSMAPGQAVIWIRNGRISPWVMLNCESGRGLIDRMSEEQINICSEILSPRLWRGKFNRMNTETESIRKLLEEYGL